MYSTVDVDDVGDLLSHGITNCMRVNAREYPIMLAHGKALDDIKVKEKVSQLSPFLLDHPSFCGIFVLFLCYFCVILCFFVVDIVLRKL